MFSSVKYLPISTAACIFFTGPIWTALIAVFYLKEPLSKSDVIALVAAFAGVLLINRPWESNNVTEEQANAINSLNTGSSSMQDTKIYTSSDKIIGTLYALSGALGAALAFICMRIMRNDIHYSVSPFWFSIGCTFLSPIFGMQQMSTKPSTYSYTGEVLVYMCIASVASFFGQVFQSRAYQLEKAARVATMNYIQIVTGFLWDILFFKSKLQVLDIIGSLLIILTLFTITVLKAMGKVK